MENTQDLTFDFVAAIPVGHRVEVVQFKEVSVDKKGRESEKPVDGLWLKDLDTGIEYGMDDHFEKRKFVVWCRAEAWPFDVRKELVVDKKFEGKVVRCRLMSMRMSSDWQMQTRMLIERTE